jgi:hypothetical protein
MLHRKQNASTKHWSRVVSGPTFYSKGKKVKQSATLRWRLVGEEIYLLLILDLVTKWGLVVSVTPRPRFAPGKGPPVPIVQEAGWASKPVWTQRLEEKYFTLPGIEPRSPGRPVPGQTLYWLSYPGSLFGRYLFKISDQRRVILTTIFCGFSSDPGQYL